MTIKIGWRKLRIKFQEPYTNSLGQLSNLRSEIIVSPNRNPTLEERQQTLIHELTHELLYIMGSEKFDDERFTDGLGEQLYTLLHENPKLLIYLLEGEIT